MIKPGRNIAIKVPRHKWEETVVYYRDKVELKIAQESKTSVAFKFGEMTLWIDCVEHQSQTDVWLELFTDDPDNALERLKSPARDELENIEDGNGRWTSDPAGVVLLLRSE